MTLPWHYSARHWRPAMGLVALSSLPWALTTEPISPPLFATIASGLLATLLARLPLFTRLPDALFLLTPMLTCCFGMTAVVATAFVMRMQPAHNWGTLLLASATVCALGLGQGRVLTRAAVAWALMLILIPMAVTAVLGAGEHWRPLSLIAMVVLLQGTAPWLSALPLDIGKPQRGAPPLIRRLK